MYFWAFGSSVPKRNGLRTHLNGTEPSLTLTLSLSCHLRLILEGALKTNKKSQNWVTLLHSTTGEIKDGQTQRNIFVSRHQRCRET